MGKSRFAKDYEKMTKKQIEDNGITTNTYVDDMIKSISDSKNGPKKADLDYQDMLDPEFEKNNEKKMDNQKLETDNNSSNPEDIAANTNKGKKGSSSIPDPYVQVGVYLTEDAKKFLNCAVRRKQCSRKTYMEYLLEKAFRKMDQETEPDVDDMDKYIRQFKSKKYFMPFEMKKIYSEKFAACAAWHYMNKSEFCNYIIIHEKEKNF